MDNKIYAKFSNLICLECLRGQKKDWRQKDLREGIAVAFKKETGKAKEGGASK